MYRYDQLTLPAGVKAEQERLLQELASKLNLPVAVLQNLMILKKSIDARQKPEIRYVYSVAFDISAVVPPMELRRVEKRSGLLLYQPKRYSFPAIRRSLSAERDRPVIVGTGPAGLFCGYFLAQNGFRPILLERGARVEERDADVRRFWSEGTLDPESNVQFGEGGAGTFSDGKLNSSVLGKSPSSDEVLRLFVRYGADPEILYSNKPHIGTDRLKKIVATMRSDMERMGAEFRFHTRLIEPLAWKGALRAIRVETAGKPPMEIETKRLVLCIGHSARDTFEALHKSGIWMLSKPFAVGLRIQHPQEWIDLAQYGEGGREKGLPAADYKLTMNASSGRSVYSFCMCPGGYVVNASSEAGRLAVNGMSNHDRDSGVANAAIVTAVDESVYGEDLLDGLKFQRRLEEAAYALGEGAIPVECVGDFLSGNAEALREGIEPKMRGAYRYAPLHTLLPEALTEDIREGVRYFGSRLERFDAEDALLAGVESRTSSPLRIPRDESGQCNIHGIFPCGEGAGYAGGITSAAADGIRAAEYVAKSY